MSLYLFISASSKRVCKGYTASIPNIFDISLDVLGAYYFCMVGNENVRGIS